MWFLYSVVAGVSPQDPEVVSGGDAPGGAGDTLACPHGTLRRWCT